VAAALPLCIIITAMQMLIQADSTGSWNGWQTPGANSFAICKKRDMTTMPA